MRRQIEGLLGPEGRGSCPAWEVLAYDGLPDIGRCQDLDDLLPWLDAVDEFGAAFESWWAMRSFGRLIEAADAFADRYQGTYPDMVGWARHTLSLMACNALAKMKIGEDASASSPGMGGICFGVPTARIDPRRIRPERT
ncbi:TPA: hypothetical protein QEK30_000848 [Stenotrophomonas maltophilia]|nr:hypothetical protein [Stenotrophomonas maltophilia]MBH1584518.1 hypothetical protein [Stenotrophomonas maltophilia]MBH1685837.1 hypothetical protein [Stenotrophomonas maltophilia]MBN5011533.1 hypothetical protein [Stenotrophomonas maltophilia]HDS1299530.1 hypothetical protein [Stenotrophomonas maltophilia]